MLRRISCRTDMEHCIFLSSFYNQFLDQTCPLLNISSDNMTLSSLIIAATLLIILPLPFLIQATNNDTYTLSSPNHKSAMFAMGCFWCAEEAFEHYAPGVIEAVSGYAGGINTFPTYRNHPGHYEVILVEYDPTKTSYEVMVQYAWRNLDPFDNDGQFCDRGSSYRPAIFYETENERIVAEHIFQHHILNKANNDSWNEKNIPVPLLQRPTFWKAENYHQNYYIKNPGNYGYYKNACRRTKRLQQVWGQDVYDCYHSLNSSCFQTVVNEDGMSVIADINIKGIGEIKPALLPKKSIVLISCVMIVSVFVIGGVVLIISKRRLKHLK